MCGMYIGFLRMLRVSKTAIHKWPRKLTCNISSGSTFFLFYTIYNVLQSET